MKIYEGILNAKNVKIAIIGARFNDFITSKLIDGAKDCFLRHGGNEKDLTLFYVPGAYEIPLMAKKLAESKEQYDAIVCLGAVIRGATPHFDYVSAEVSKGIANVSLNSNKPIIFSVLTTDSIEQAIERAGTKPGDKGWDAVLSAIEITNTFKSMDKLQ